MHKKISKHKIKIVSLSILSIIVMPNFNQADTNSQNNVIKPLEGNLDINKKADSVFSKIKIPAPVYYKGNTLRAPFDNSEMISKKVIHTNPLLNYPLAMLKFLGTMEQGNKLFGYILAPDNKMYQVKTGDLIGDQEGKIIDIDQKHIKVLERNPDDGNKKIIETLMLKDES